MLLYIKTKAARLCLFLWVKLAGQEPDYSELIAARTAMIEKSIAKADTWYKLGTCKEAVSVLLMPFEKEAAKEIKHLNHLIEEQELAIMGSYAVKQSLTA